jgi:hypothetical protein
MLMSHLITTQAGLPDEWKWGRVILLPKLGSPTDPGNYRPITLLQVAYKIHTKIITNWLTKVASAHILANSQLGFWPGMSSQSAL